MENLYILVFLHLVLNLWPIYPCETYPILLPFPSKTQNETVALQHLNTIPLSIPNRT